MQNCTVFNNESFAPMQTNISTATRERKWRLPSPIVAVDGMPIATFESLIDQILTVTSPAKIQLYWGAARDQNMNLKIGRSDVMWCAGLANVLTIVGECLGMVLAVKPEATHYVESLTLRQIEIHNALLEAEDAIKAPEKVEEAPELEGVPLTKEAEEWKPVVKRQRVKQAKFTYTMSESEGEPIDIDPFADNVTSLVGRIPWDFEVAKTSLMYFPPSNYVKEKLSVDDNKNKIWVKCNPDDKTKYPKDQVRFMATNRGGFMIISEQSPEFITECVKANWIPETIAGTYRAIAKGTVHDSGQGKIWEDPFPGEGDEVITNPIPRHLDTDAQIAFMNYQFARCLFAMRRNLPTKVTHMTTWYSMIIRTNMPHKFEVLERWIRSVKGVAGKSWPASLEDKKEEGFTQTAFDRKYAINQYNRSFSSFLSACMCSKPDTMTVDTYVIRTLKSRRFFACDDVAAEMIATAYRRTKAAASSTAVANSTVNRLFRNARTAASIVQKEAAKAMKAAEQATGAVQPPVASQTPSRSIGERVGETIGGVNASMRAWLATKRTGVSSNAEEESIPNDWTREQRRAYRRLRRHELSDIDVDTSGADSKSQSSDGDDSDTRAANVVRLKLWRKRHQAKLALAAARKARSESWYGRVINFFKTKPKPTSTQTTTFLASLASSVGVVGGIALGFMVSPWLMLLAPIMGAASLGIISRVCKFFRLDFLTRMNEMSTAWVKRFTLAHAIEAGAMLAIFMIGTPFAIGFATTYISIDCVCALMGNKKSSPFLAFARWPFMAVSYCVKSPINWAYKGLSALIKFAGGRDPDDIT